MSENGDDAYDNSHRAFFQSFISRATLTFDQAKPVLAAIISAHGSHQHRCIRHTHTTDPIHSDGRDTQPADITMDILQSYINVTNAAISPFDMEIRSTLNQKDKTRIWALVNVASDSITQLATTHTPDEIAFVKRVLDAMFETNNTYRSEVMAINATSALRLAKAPGGQTQDVEATQGAAAQSLTMMQAQKMLQAMVDEGWFAVSPKEFYSLSPRALMELRGWLVETYNDEEEEKIRFCYACKDIVTLVCLGVAYC